MYSFFSWWVTLQFRKGINYRIDSIFDSRNPANIHLDEDVLKTSWSRLSSLSSEDVLKTSSKRLDQDEYVRLCLTTSEEVLKTSWSRPIYSSWTYVFKTSSRRLVRGLENVSKTSSGRLRRYKIVTLKTCWRPTNICWEQSMVKIWKSNYYCVIVYNYTSISCY